MGFLALCLTVSTFILFVYALKVTHINYTKLKTDFCTLFFFCVCVYICSCVYRSPGSGRRQGNGTCV